MVRKEGKSGATPAEPRNSLISQISQQESVSGPSVGWVGRSPGDWALARGSAGI